MSSQSRHSVRTVRTSLCPSPLLCCNTRVRETWRVAWSRDGPPITASAGGVLDDRRRPSCSRCHDGQPLSFRRHPSSYVDHGDFGPMSTRPVTIREAQSGAVQEHRAQPGASTRAARDRPPHLWGAQVPSCLQIGRFVMSGRVCAPTRPLLTTDACCATNRGSGRPMFEPLHAASERKPVR
jgi:hypothetical protein